ncbi:MAG TPA: DUF3307 domain-containing protein [Acholeplasmataceae bacterium]|jgi:hypothetical protein|nr:DUF3307 domain-containing protein [Acholeplasmataceae bacterium]
MRFFVIFLLAHILGDYTFQPLSLSEKKKESLKYVALHSLIYAFLAFLASLLIKVTVFKIVFPLIILVSHFLIDWLRIWFDRKFPDVRFRFASFFVDQLLHILLLFLLTKDFVPEDSSRLGVRFYGWLTRIIAPLSIDQFLKIALAYLIILQPASIFIKHFFNLVFRKDLCAEEESQAGSVIGKLERLVILTLGIMGLHTAIALVFTAKSIARFKQLEERGFAERYLIGTLLSFLIAILCLLLVGRSFLPF